MFWIITSALSARSQMLPIEESLLFKIPIFLIIMFHSGNACIMCLIAWFGTLILWRIFSFMLYSGSCKFCLMCCVVHTGPPTRGRGGWMGVTWKACSAFRPGWQVGLQCNWGTRRSPACVNQPGLRNTCKICIPLPVLYSVTWFFYFLFFCVSVCIVWFLSNQIGEDDVNFFVKNFSILLLTTSV